MHEVDTVTFRCFFGSVSMFVFLSVKRAVTDMETYMLWIAFLNENIMLTPNYSSSLDINMGHSNAIIYIISDLNAPF